MSVGHVELYYGDLKITFQSRWYIIRRAPLLEKVQYIYITIFKARL